MVVHKKSAGAKALDGCTSPERRQIKIDPKSEATFMKIGNGNLSLGIREVARRVAEAGNTQPFDASQHEKGRNNRTC